MPGTGGAIAKSSLLAALTAVGGLAPVPTATADRVRDAAGMPTVERHPSAAALQSVVVDGGSFTIVRGTTKIGREEFTIRRAPSPDGTYLATGTVVYADRRLTPALTTDSAGAPQRYQIEMRAGDRRDEVLSLQIVRGHGSQRIVNARGESATEFGVAVNARLLDDDVFDQYYFLARVALLGGVAERGVTIVVPLLLPHQSRQAAARVLVVGDDTVEIAGHVVVATHLHVTPAVGDERDVWADGAGRVLRVAIPRRGVVATRDDVPR